MSTKLPKTEFTQVWWVWRGVVPVLGSLVSKSLATMHAKLAQTQVCASLVSLARYWTCVMIMSLCVFSNHACQTRTNWVWTCSVSLSSYCISAVFISFDEFRNPCLWNSAELRLRESGEFGKVLDLCCGHEFGRVWKSCRPNSRKLSSIELGEFGKVSDVCCDHEFRLLRKTFLPSSLKLILSDFSEFA